MRKDSVWHNRTGGYIETTSPTGYDVLINGSSKYLNFNLISGETGYGIRDNAGTMQFKNSGGSWTNFGAGGGGGAVDSVNGQTGVVVLTTADIADSLNKRYVTDAQLTVIGNTSGTNTGDQTTITGNAGTATILQTTRTIWGQNFNGSANVTGTLALGASDLTLTGSIGATGARATKIWTAALESTAMPTVGGTAILTSLTAPQFTTLELGHASDTTLSRVSAGLIAVEGNNIAKSVDIQTFTSSGTWTKPANALFVKIFLIGGGGGGGSGRRGAVGSVRCGGGGGSGGGIVVTELPASFFASTETVTVGAGGAGGSAQTTNDTNGNTGTDGGISSFSSGATVIESDFGSGGSGGSATSGTGGVATTGAYITNTATTGSGASASATGAIGSSGANASNVAPRGGGGGGGVTSANSQSAGGAGGDSSTSGNAGFPSTGGAGGTAGGGTGGTGSSQPANIYFGGGGGGGGGGTSDGVTAGGTGGAGGTYGGGGGGGGASTNGANSGAGGAGKNGIVVVVTYF